MAARLLWSRQAREDLLEIYTTIGLKNPSAAERLYNAVEAKALKLADHPRLGRRRPEIRPGARQLVLEPYLILYETHPDTERGPVNEVKIVRVVHGRRDLTHLF